MWIIGPSGSVSSGAKPDYKIAVYDCENSHKYTNFEKALSEETVIGFSMKQNSQVRSL
jgi:hypothetical protein